METQYVMNIVLGCLLWICSVAEIFLCYCFVDLMEGEDLVRKNRILVGVCSVIVGSLLAYNRSLRGGLVSWGEMLIQTVLIFCSMIRRIDRKKRKKCFGLILSYNICIAHIQLFVSFFMLGIFHNIDFTLLYLVFGKYKVGCSIVSFVVSFLVFLMLLRYIKKYQLEMQWLKKSIYLFDLIGFILLIFMQSQLVDYGLNRSVKNLIATSIFICFIILMVFVYLKNTEALTEAKLLSDNYQGIREGYQNFAYTSHDMKNHLLLLKHFCEEGKVDKARAYIEEMQGSLSMGKEYIRSGNEVTDMILNYKLAIAEREGTQVDVKADPLEDLHVEDSDWCIILSNLLDNAIEACRSISQGDRWIRIRIKMQGEMLVIKISNTFSQDHKATGAKGVEEKQSRRIHGYGKKSVKAKVEKYGGNVEWEQEGNVHTAMVTFFNKNR